MKYKLSCFKSCVGFNNVVASRLAAAFTSLLALVVLTACVTTQRGGFADDASVEEATKIRVEAAKRYLSQAEPDFEQARRHLRLALEQSPKSPDVHDALALSFQFSEEFELADLHFRNAVKWGDGASRYRNNYASFLFQQEEFKKAERQLIHVAKDSLYERRESALVLLGLAQQQLIDTTGAQKSFEQALVLNPRNTIVLRELSIMSYDAEKYRESWAYYQRFRQATKQRSPEMLLLGVQLAKNLGNNDAFVSYALSLKNLYPDSREYKSYLKQFAQPRLN